MIILTMFFIFTNILSLFRINFKKSRIILLEHELKLNSDENDDINKEMDREVVIRVILLSILTIPILFLYLFYLCLAFDIAKLPTLVMLTIMVLNILCDIIFKEKNKEIKKAKNNIKLEELKQNKLKIWKPMTYLTLIYLFYMLYMQVI